MPEKHTGESSTSESGSSAVHACGSKGEEGCCTFCFEDEHLDFCAFLKEVKVASQATPFLKQVHLRQGGRAGWVEKQKGLDTSSETHRDRQIERTKVGKRRVALPRLGKASWPCVAAAPQWCRR